MSVLSFCAVGLLGALALILAVGAFFAALSIVCAVGWLVQILVAVREVERAWPRADARDRWRSSLRGEW